MKQAHKNLRKELNEIMNENPSLDPQFQQMKKLGKVQAEVMLELVETLERLDEGNKQIAESNLSLTASNLKLSNQMLWLQATSTGLAFIALLVALFLKSHGG